MPADARIAAGLVSGADVARRVSLPRTGNKEQAFNRADERNKERGVRARADAPLAGLSTRGLSRAANHRDVSFMSSIASNSPWGMGSPSTSPGPRRQTTHHVW
jgi:hypothetical protein